MTKWSPVSRYCTGARTLSCSRPSVALPTSAPFDSPALRCPAGSVANLGNGSAPHLFAHFGVTFSREFRPVDALIPCRSVSRASACLPYRHTTTANWDLSNCPHRVTLSSRSFRPASIHSGDVTALRYPSRLPAYRLDSTLNEQRTRLRLDTYGPSASRGEPATGHATRCGRAAAPECSQVAFRRRRTRRRLRATHAGPQRQCRQR